MRSTAEQERQRICGSVRWRRFSAEEVSARDDLKFKWLDFAEEDERSVVDIIDEMQEEADNITYAVIRLKELLGGIQL